jgi:hypothetical protein
MTCADFFYGFHNSSGFEFSEHLKVRTRCSITRGIEWTELEPSTIPYKGGKSILISVMLLITHPVLHDDPDARQKTLKRTGGRRRLKCHGRQENFQDI